MTHLLFFASYAAVSAAAGFVLSRSMIQLAPMTCYLIAAGGFLLTSLIHEVISRRIDQRDLLGQLDMAFDELDEMREANLDLTENLVRAREEMVVLASAVETAAVGTNEALVREMKALQSQLGVMQKVERPKAERPGRVRPAVEKANEGAGNGSAGSNAAGQTVQQDEVEAEIDREVVLSHIREALETNRIDLYMQPIVSLPQRRTQHYEAFARIRTSGGRIIAAQQYLDVAKENGLIGAIDNLLLMRCVQILRRNEKRQGETSFFVNISHHTLNDEDFLTQFIDFMASNPSLASNLIFEIRQKDFLSLSEVALHQLGRLGELNFRFSMDQVTSLDIDFPALAQFRFCFIKVPVRLLVTLPEDSGEWVHPRNLKAKSAVSDIHLVVERIEQESDVIEVLEYGFDYGQGFLFGAPRPSRAEARAA